ncbi:hypothetical protein CDQ92_10635 [Sphingopyxis bauzanensis]|uniref:AAA+ ATPase domain-containing protein n=1 Tax=Sphingopyxis bauzanensis TaxID=651663 RepID=A0A246JX06_9SPHN|nr:AAA family ATPase [Sphingopyxis bauzanensis]OWQ97466.1 hypothetical protein CDQ92_10635 [Sphingopyxis bauzanensis]GGJ36257.1 hypothetical protein GCM10011393_03340 [Sphingopyxis bauzanensis]
MHVLSWAEKYRPTKFSDVVGQASAVKQLKERVSSSKKIASVILEGPSGSGKTTLARIFAKTMQCSAPQDSGEACGGCHACDLFEANHQPSFHRINAGLDGTMAGIRELLEEDLVTRPHSAALHVVFFDEADNLTEKAQRALLAPLEDGSLFALYIFSLIDADELLPPLRARCTRIELVPPTWPEALAYLEKIVAAERLTVEPGALEIIARLVPSFRELANTLESVFAAAAGGKITPALARTEVRKRGTEEIVGYLVAALDGDAEGQLDAMRSLRLSAKEKADAVLELLTYLKLRYVGPARTTREHMLDLLLDEAECQRIVAGIGWRAEKLGIELEVLLDEVLEFWTFQPLRMDEAALGAHMARFNDLFLMDRPFPRDRTGIALRLATARDAAEFRSSRGRRRPPAWRTGDTAEATDPAEYLSERQVRELYEAATFMVQRHRRTFNACLTLDHNALGIVEDKKAADLVSDLLRELGLRLQDWARSSGAPEQADLHRISFLERGREGGLRSTVLLHLPGFAADPARHWIFERFLARRCTVGETWHSEWLRVQHVDEARGALAVHWALLRTLWRGTDPGIVVEGEPLVERLKVARRERRPAGKITQRRFGLSQGLSKAARTGEAELLGAHLSAYTDGAWSWLFSRWEWAEAEKRKKARMRLAELGRASDREGSATCDPLSVRKLTFEVRLAADEGRKVMEIRQKPWDPPAST